MQPKSTLCLLLALASLLLALTALPPANATASFTQDPQPPLELAGSVTVNSPPNAMIVRCEGHQCSRYHELVYWGFDNKIYFYDARTLSPSAQPLATSSDIASFIDERYLFYDRHYHQIYALDRYDEGTYPNVWRRLQVNIIRGYGYADSAVVNASFNTGTPIDRYYPIDGADFQQPLINTGSVAKIFVDNTVTGNVDIVTFHGHYPQTAFTTRITYRTPLNCAASPSYCSWHVSPGSSLAVDAANRVYLADNNDFNDRIVVRNPDGSALPNINNIGPLFPCFVEEAGLGMAPDENRLYLPAGCQSFANGAVARLDITSAGAHDVVDLPYYDQDMLVDWFDQKRVFIATADFSGNYDPDRHLYLHLLYDGQLIASLAVLANYQLDSLGAMTFDPYTNTLYLAVKSTIYRVRVNYGGTAGYPPLPSGEADLAPASTGQLRASDSSAVFQFGAGMVNEAVRATYHELPPDSLPGSPGAGTAAGLYTLRQFELSAAATASGTPLASFNNDYRLDLYYSPREMVPILGGAAAARLYRWNGSTWQPVGNTYASGSENLLYIYTQLTGRFAVMGPTRQVYLPAILR